MESIYLIMPLLCSILPPKEELLCEIFHLIIVRCLPGCQRPAELATNAMQGFFVAMSELLSNVVEMSSCTHVSRVSCTSFPRLPFILSCYNFTIAYLLLFSLYGSELVWDFERFTTNWIFKSYFSRVNTLKDNSELESLLRL